MKKLLLFTVLLSVLVSCGGRKQVEKALYNGNYDTAITKALKKLRNNKDKKRKQDFIVMLQDAYYKVVERDLNSIKHLKQDGNPENYKVIYNLYTNLDARQEAIKPVLPLTVNGKLITFQFNDYSSDIVSARADVSNHFYNKADALLKSNDKYAAREAHSHLSYIENINPNFKNVADLLQEAHFKGTDFVIVSIENDTHQIIPRRLEEELLDFNTYGLNNFWTVYHAQTNTDVTYDYSMQLQLKQINISPERINEKQLLRQKQIVDGWEYLLDDNGNVAKDSLGNDIKVDKIVNVRARLFETLQTKSAQVIGKVVYQDLQTNQVIDSLHIDSAFVFENLFADFRGDRRALNANDRALLRNDIIPFPSDEQLVYNTGEDLKQKLKQIIANQRFRS